MRSPLIRCRTVVLTFLVFLGGIPLAALAQDAPNLQAYRIESSVAVDGRLSEQAWQEADAVSNFRQFEPDEGAPATYPTEVHVLYGPGNVYIGAILYDEHPAQIWSTLGSRDDFNQADWFTVSIDSYFNQTTAYIFAVNAAGVQYDAIGGGGGGGPGRRGGPGDSSWDAIWEASARVNPQGWVVEMRIPYSQLRFSEGSSTWGIHFTRSIPRLAERSEWPLVPRTERANLVAQFGLLTGLQNIEPRRNLQLRPYVVSRLQTQESLQQPGQLSYVSSVDVGGDLKVGISSNITLDMTINPDFGQVEADPARLNLTAFETFYEERRPFFLEGVQIYKFGLGRRSDLLYTRRIGAQAPIVGAAKLSGRTSGGLSFGFLGASTGENFNPVRHYGVIRLSQEIGSFSSVGGILTGFSGPTPAGRRNSLAGGADWDLRFLGNAYGLEGYAVFTHREPTAGLPAVTGWAASLQGERREGIWTYDVGISVFDDKFDPNDLGRLRRNNYINVSAGVRHDINGGDPFGPFQRAGFGFFVDQDWSYRNRINQGLGFFSFSNWTLRGFQSIGFNASSDYLFGGYNLYGTRGLGPWAAPLNLELSAEFETDERRSWQVEPEAGITYYGKGGRGYALGLRGSWNIGSRLTLRGGVDFEWENNRLAWASNETFWQTENGWKIGMASTSPARLGPGEFEPFDHQGRLDDILLSVDPFGRGDQYYVPVFGRRDTRSFDFTLRSSITFMPGLSLQFYGQLFVARGRYNHFQILTDPDTLVPFDSYPKRRAFALSSFTANTVLRWQYRPGSTLYLVWTQGRRLNNRLNPLAPWGQSPYEIPTGEQLMDTFSIFPQNAFLVKIDYTFLR